jgi:hypothetical protein
MIPHELFPRLTRDNHRSVSPLSVGYNCVAWGVGDTKRWWQPGIYCPVEASRDDHGMGALQEAFKALGCKECPDGPFEPGFEKTALYGSRFMYTHAARQLPSGKWTSKLGKAEDIEHNRADDVGGGVYGEVVAFMRRPVGQG